MFSQVSVRLSVGAGGRVRRVLILSGGGVLP